MSRKLLEEKIKKLEQELANTKLLLENKTTNEFKKYKLLADNITDIIIQVDKNLNPIYISPSIEHVSGYTVDEILAKDIFELALEEDREHLKNEMALHIKKKKPTRTTEYRILDKNGEIKWISASSKYMYSEQGEFEGLISLARDITDRVKTEHALKESEERFKRLVNYSSSLILEVDADSYIVTACNPAIAKSLGKDVDDIVGMNIKELLPPDVMNQRVGIAEKTIRENKVIQHEDERNGRHFLSYYIPVFANNKRFVQTVSYDITNQKNAEKALKKSEERFKLAMHATNDGLWDWDIKSNDVYFSPGWFKILGIDPSFNFQTWESRIHKDDKSEVINQLNTHLNGETDSWLMEHRLLTNDGIYKWVQGKGKVVERNSDGTPVRMVGKMTDITNRKKIEQALKESEAKFRSIIENASPIIFTIDKEGKFLLSEGKSLEKLGLKPGQVVGMSAFEVYKDYPSIIHGIKDALAGKTYRDLVQLGEIYFDVFYTPNKEKSGNFDSIIGMAIDITDRITAEKALKESEAKFKLIIDKSTDVIWTQDMSFNTTYMSPSVEKMLGYTVDEYLSMHVSERLPEESVPIAIYELTKNLELIKKGEADVETHTFKFEMLHKHKSGRLAWGEVNCSFLYDEHKNITGIHGITRNIDDRKKAENALKESEEKYRNLSLTKDKFFSIISHDLKNPLSSIYGFSELTLQKLETVEFDKVYDYAKLINKTSQHTLELLINLLDWSRVQSGKIDFNPININLHKIVQDTLFLLEANYTEKSIDISIQIDQNIDVFADEPMTKTIIRNLLSNAIKFSNEKDIIKINSQKKNDEIVLSIEDSGVGIDKETLKQLFNIEDSFSTKGTKNETGTGLGLILCKEFVEKQGGEIWVESTVDKGSTFYFTVPLKEKN